MTSREFIGACLPFLVGLTLAVLALPRSEATGVWVA